jgi:hypothetical protein
VIVSKRIYIAALVALLSAPAFAEAGPIIRGLRAVNQNRPHLIRKAVQNRPHLLGRLFGCGG